MVAGHAVLSLQHIDKTFPGSRALDDVSLAVNAGEVHALIGENGAGKSTLLHVAYGMVAPDRGTIAVSLPGRASIAVPAFASPRAAREAGIGMVHQHFTSIPAFTVAENIALSAGWAETGRDAEHRAAAVIADTGLGLDVTRHVESLSAQSRQRLEIAKALAGTARVLLLDEPTAVLAPPEVEELLQFLRGLAQAGGAVLLVTHKLDDVIGVADRVTVLRRGATILTDSVAGQTRQSLVHAMVGENLGAATKTARQSGAVMISADRLTLRRGDDSRMTRRARVNDGPVRITEASFSVCAGEVVGIAAVDGNGQRELLRAIAGVDHVEIASGTLTVTGPIAFIPEDRTSEGLVPSFTAAENLLLGTLDQSSWWLDWKEIRRRTGELFAANDIRGGGPDLPVAALSGGNQQKLVVATAMTRQPRVIVAEDPTRGLDVHAAAAIHERLFRAAQEGAAVIVHSSDVDEVMLLADRVLVVANGRVMEPAATPTRESIGEAMLSTAAVT